MILRILAVLSLPCLASLALGQEPRSAVSAGSGAAAHAVPIGSGGGLVGAASGKGFLVDNSGVIATDLGLIKGAEYVSVRNRFGQVAYGPRIVGYDEGSNLVLLRFPGFRFEAPPRDGAGDPAGAALAFDRIAALLQSDRDISLDDLNEELGLTELMSGREPPTPAEAFARETRDETWAAPLEQRVLAILAATPALALSSVQVECRATVCRAELVAAGGDDFRALHGRLRELGLELRVETLVDEGGVRSVDYTLFAPRARAFGHYGSQLEEAIELKDDTLALFLIETGADLDRRYYIGWTPLSRAAQYGNLTVVQALLAAGADPSIADDEGRTPLDQATAFAVGYSSGSMDPRALGPNAEQRVADYRAIVELLEAAR